MVILSMIDWSSRMWLKLDDGRLINLDLVTDIRIENSSKFYNVRFVSGDECDINPSEYQRLLTTLSKAKILSVS